MVCSTDCYLPFTKNGLRQPGRQDGQTGRQLRILKHTVRRQSQYRRCEVPDGAHAAGNHHVGNLLSGAGGHGNNSDRNMHPPGQVGELLSREHLLAVNGLADLGRVVIERGHNLEFRLLQPLIAEQGRPEASRAHEKGVGQIVPAECSFDGINQRDNGVADSRRPNNSGELKVLADLHRIEFEFLGDVRA